jgi:hypothetical protein
MEVARFKMRSRGYPLPKSHDKLFATATYKLCFTEGRKIRHDRKKKAGFVI